MGGAWTAGAALVAETWLPEHRGKGGALMQIGLPLGSMLAIAAVAAVTAGPLTAELAPPGAGRALFMGLAYNGGCLGGLLAPFLIYSLASSDSGFMIGMATAIPAFVFAALFIVLIPETKGMELQ